MSDSDYQPSQPIIVFLMMMSFCLSAAGQSRMDFEAARRQLVDREIAGAGIKNPRVLDSIRQTPRHEFVPAAQRKLAYFDMALPIGNSQTISSPFIVAFMTDALAPEPTDKVLEIGTGSGYQAAVLGSLVRDVYTIEIVEQLGRKAARTLRRLQFENVHVKIGDGFAGWPEHAPFDKIVVTCSPESVPQPLVDQLTEGGHMVIPVGERYQQTLYLFTKKDGKLMRESLRPTLFVPMTGEAESRRDIKPDPTNPTVVNGSFEAEPETEGQLPGWYYQRQLELISEKTAAPVGERYVRFANTTPGRGSRALQGLAIDGRSVSHLTVSAWIKTREVVAGPGHVPGADNDRLPTIALTFYDAQRRQLGHFLLGNWQGTQDWERVTMPIDVPPSTREAILRLGLFGATGEFCVDDVRLNRASETIDK